LRRLEPVEQAAGFFPDIVDPLAEVRTHGAVAVTFEPDKVSMDAVEQRQNQDHGSEKG